MFGGFQIPMQHAARVCGTQPGGELPCHLESLCAGRLSDAAKQRRQRFAVHVLHRQVVPSVRVADVIDAADIWVCDATREPNLISQALQTVVPAGNRLRHQLQRDGLAQPQVVRPIHLAHCAAPEQADDAVSSGKDAPWRKPRIVQRVEPEAGRNVGSSGGLHATGRPCAANGRWTEVRTIETAKARSDLTAHRALSI